RVLVDREIREKRTAVRSGPRQGGAAADREADALEGFLARIEQAVAVGVVKHESGRRSAPGEWPGLDPPGPAGVARAADVEGPGPGEAAAVVRVRQVDAEAEEPLRARGGGEVLRLGREQQPVGARLHDGLRAD